MSVVLLTHPIYAVCATVQTGWIWTLLAMKTMMMRWIMAMQVCHLASLYVSRSPSPFPPPPLSLALNEPRDIRSIYDQTATLCTAALLTAIITGLATRVRFQSHPSQSADIATGEDDDDKSAAAGDDGEEEDEEDTTPVTRFVKVVAVFSAIGGMLFG